MSEYNKLQTYILKKHSRNFHQIMASAWFPNRSQQIPTVTSVLLLWHVSPPSFLPTLCSSFSRTKLLHCPNKWLTSLVSYFGHVIPKVIKNTNHRKPVDIWSTGIIASTHIHIQKMPPSLPSKMLTPKLNFRVYTGIGPNSWFDISLPSIHSIVLLLRGLNTIFGLPPIPSSPSLPTCHPTLISPLTSQLES